ncbi:hypothetical protein [Flavobacterium sp.]|uniref:hypothetical protein n=1 Tax=Flavobacterium sp. TaxID=239 RepID=UPI002624B343|nr:hypothetical protein [Flavobacterium sp.]
MKKVFSAFVCLFLLNSCDDGDIVVETFDFGSVAVQKCSNNDILLKTSGNQLMLLNISPTFFKNEETPLNTPRAYTLLYPTDIIYRSYSGGVTSSSICATIPPSSPSVVDEYNVRPGGTVEVTTSMIPTVDATSLSTRISYSHLIKFKNVQFTNNTSTISFPEYLFGTYTSANNTLSFSFPGAVPQNCSDNKIYLKNGGEFLLVDLPAGSYPSVAGTQTISLGDTAKVISRMYSTSVAGSNPDYSAVVACAGSTPTAPVVLSEEWIATQGTVTIVTTEIFDASNTTVIGYKHNLTFQNIVYQKGTQSFTHPQYTFGDYTTN